MASILVTGANGQLGNEMRVISNGFAAHNFIFTDVAELDICDANAVGQFLDENKFDFILNCAAYTAVDKAEDDIETCFKINKDAVAVLAEASSKRKIKIIHISTDYVFDGSSYIPYTEEMSVCPSSVYGKSKQEGEDVLLKICPDSVIIRTSWLYSSFGNNFVKTMIKLGKERDGLNVIFDQIGTPTYAADLAEAMMKVVEADKFVPGIYHFSNEGVCSWYDFTITIHQMLDIDCKVLPIESKEYPVRTPRPHYSVLNKAKIKSVYGVDIPHWTNGLKRCLELL